ncbi:diacylglycerol kinase family protein [Sporolactobacillus sp. Y61]|jgi:diacylglycerol kinase|uniref:Diacylglycerol kinase family protein n=1 Tax=Sporolactobacillus sp. Y61 TaxID=3160863 RepID=A0AAU8IER2_9BACL|nr:diacylglycerol kinase family protein [Sporolactobacillus sp. THM19-2]RYL90404.1 diacylglycerol kinase family protein [Sporolactobacillus sp. THM19-2]
MKRYPAEHRKHKKLPRSFVDAISGFRLAVLQERNIRLQLFAAVVVLIFSLVIGVSRSNLLIILILIGGVISLELVNTAVERAVDLVTREPHPMAKAAKDAAAAAVWWFSVIATIIFAIILYTTFMTE